MFRCKVCAEKDARITELRSQVEMLSKLVFPAKPTQDITLEESERDALFSGIIPIVSDTEREAAAFLTGSYDNPESL